MRMRYTNFEHGPKRVEDELERNSLSLSVEVAAKRFVELTAEIDGLLLCLKDYNCVEGKFRTDSIGEGATVKAITALLKLLEKKVCSIQEENGLLKTRNEKLIRRYREQKNLMGRSVWKLLKSVATHFPTVERCISRTITKWLHTIYLN